MELFASLLAVLCIALCARIIWGNKKLAIAELEIDELCEAGYQKAFKIERLEKEHDHLINGGALEWQGRNEAEAIANLAMRVGLEAKQAAYEQGYERGWQLGLQDARDTCLQYSTSRGSAIAKRIVW